MKAVAVIPARWASTRLPGKVLADIGGKPLIQHVWERVKTAREIAKVVVACDEAHVADRIRAFGADARLTRKDHVSGSDRVAEIAERLEADIVVNIQGDEPFIDPLLIDELVRALANDRTSVMATVIKRITIREDFLDPNIVKAVIDKDSNALYFSRAPIPYRRDGERIDFSCCFRHIGIYAYRRAFLLSYCKWPRSYLEQEESLEQLRVLENGGRIKTVETRTEAIGIDTPEDLVKANDLYRKLHS